MNIPKISEIATSIFNDFVSQFGSGSTYLGKLYIRAQITVLAAKQYLMYLEVAKVDKNIFADTAEPESQGGSLDRYGRVKLGRERREAQAGEYDCDVSGEIGATISAGTTFKSDDDSANAGFLFILDQDFTFATTGGAIKLRALDAGLESELVEGNTLTATAPILNVDQGATVSLVVLAPLAAETVEEYRTAIVLSFQTEPQGGSSSDYILWGFDATGVVGIYPYASGSTANSIDVYVEANTVDGIAPPTVLAEVAEVIEQDPDTTKPLNERGRRPLGVLQVNTKSITLGSVDVTITGLFNNDAVIQGLIESAILDLLNDIRPFIASAQSLSGKNDVLTGGRLVATIQAAIGSSNYFSGLTWSVNGNVQTTSYTFTNGEIPQLGTITYN